MFMFRSSPLFSVSSGHNNNGAATAAVWLHAKVDIGIPWIMQHYQEEKKSKGVGLVVGVGLRKSWSQSGSDAKFARRNSSKTVK